MKMYEKIKTESKWDRIRYGINTNWIINNNSEILKTISMLYKDKKGMCVNTFDFTTLYTTIDHKLLIETMKEMINEYYVYNTDISVYKKTISSKYNILPKQKLFRALCILIHQCFFL